MDNNQHYTAEDLTTEVFETLARYRFGTFKDLTPEEAELASDAANVLRNMIYDIGRNDIGAVLDILEKGLEHENPTLRWNAVIYACFAFDAVQQEDKNLIQNKNRLYGFITKALQSDDLNVVKNVFTSGLMMRVSGWQNAAFSESICRDVLLGTSPLRSHPETQEELAKHFLAYAVFGPKSFVTPLVRECLQKGNDHVKALMIRPVLFEMARMNLNAAAGLVLIEEILLDTKSPYRLDVAKNIIPVIVEDFPYQTEPVLERVLNALKKEKKSLRGAWETIQHQEIVFALKHAQDEVPANKKAVDEEKKYQARDPQFFW